MNSEIERRPRRGGKHNRTELLYRQATGVEVLVFSERDEVALHRMPMAADGSGERTYSPDVRAESANHSLNKASYSLSVNPSVNACIASGTPA